MKREEQSNGTNKEKKVGSYVQETGQSGTRSERFGCG
jgi:hypothetical protein